ncbi:MAG TPA: oligosaccharide flippase family protein [Acidimicrobiales bacterium]|nr:oligosaccharide flippase family protein [Acidimicrobiales bacterium]
MTDGDPVSEPAPESALPHRFGANVLSNYLALAVTAVSAIVVTPLLLHHLGRTAFGIWVLASTVVAYLELFELGFGGASTKLVAEDAHVRPEQAVRMINTTFFVLVPMGVIALVVGVAIAFFFPHIVQIAPHMRGEVFVCVTVLAVGLAVSIPGDTFGGSLGGYQRFDLLSLANASMGIAIAVASVVVVLLGGGIVALAVATSAITVGFQGVRWAMLRHVIPGARIRPRLIDKLRLRAAANISGWFLVYALLQTSLAASDVVIVGIVLGVKPAAVYAVGAKLAKAANLSLDSLAIVFFPYASATLRNKDRDALKDIVIDGIRVTLLVGVLISLLLMVLAGPGIRGWVGPGYDTSAHVLVILALAVGFASPVKCLAQVLLGSGDLKVLCWVSGIEVLVNVVLSIILANAIGPLGVAVGTLGGVLLVRLPGLLVIGNRAVNVAMSEVVRGAIVPHILPAGACAGVLLAGRALTGYSFIGAFVIGIAGAVTYLVLYLTTGAPASERERALGVVRKIGSGGGRGGAA